MYVNIFLAKSVDAFLSFILSPPPPSFDFFFQIGDMKIKFGEGVFPKQLGKTVETFFNDKKNNKKFIEDFKPQIQKQVRSRDRLDLGKIRPQKFRLNSALIPECRIRNFDNVLLLY